MIIDSHAHLGTDLFFEMTITADDLLQPMDAYGIDAAIVLALPGARDERSANDDIAELASRHPGRFYGVANPNPHQDEEKFFEEASRTVQKLGFVGLKLHTQAHCCPPTAGDAAKAFRAARALGVPLIIHTGLGVPYALPSLVIPRAMEYPDVKIVLAHSGAYIYTLEAIVAAQVCPNIYLETSWCAPHRIKEMAEKIGPHRVMFGIDLPVCTGTELAKYRTNGMSDEMRDICMAETAREVFGLD